MSAPAVSARGLAKRFGPREALRGLTFDAEPGRCLAVVGHNGSGKTTLLRILATLSRADAGELSVAGRSLPKESVAVRARIGVVLDDALLPSDLSLAEGLRMHADLHGVPSPEARIAELCERFGLAPRQDDPVRTFSRGMLQRAALCRALLHAPELLLLDEPSNGLDASGTALLDAEIRAHCARGGAAVLVTHDLERVAACADRALHLRSGRIDADGPAADVIRALRGGAAA
ncbi:MAG: ABC transporter ATP-binding protein NatA [Planctomycetes bacterium]|nr:ABC transporter ATP-binding protein NatA [Planctomycetota bacterium]